MDLEEDYARIRVDEIEKIEESFRFYGCNALDIAGTCYPIIDVDVAAKEVVIGPPMQLTYH